MTPPLEPALPPVEILLAEDSPTQAQRLRHILVQQGYNVRVGTNGRFALEAARRKRPDVIISDVVMPEMDGYELCRQIKADPELGEVPVILVTSLSDPQDVIRGLECRADYFILKPYNEHYLLGRVQFVLVNREMREAKQGGMGVEIFFNGSRHFITAERLQILNLLLSTYEAAIQRNKELTRAQEELRLVNEQLQFANKELESFSYSVSHDLRAPLRHIDGFANLLLEGYHAQLPPEAQRMLKNVCAGAKHLGQLIDDLLNFSRLSRQPLAKREVNLQNLVQQILEELRGDQADRKLEVRVGELPKGFGDPALLRQVLVNLLSNALKFTRHRTPAVVEVEGEAQNGEITLTVRDNGAGFDMQYAERLFGVFQRLHRADEFEGTGVGLSIVERIIHRHGGRIWAEGVVGEGATFSFTLPVPLAE